MYYLSKILVSTYKIPLILYTKNNRSLFKPCYTSTRLLLFYTLPFPLTGEWSSCRGQIGPLTQYGAFWTQHIRQYVTCNIIADIFQTVSYGKAHDYILSLDMWHIISTYSCYLFFKSGDQNLCFTLWHSTHTEYYAEAWGVSKEGASSEETAKKWIVHVKIGKSRGDRLRRFGRNSILKGWEGDQSTSTDRQAVTFFYGSYEEAVSIRFGRSIIPRARCEVNWVLVWLDGGWMEEEG